MVTSVEWGMYKMFNDNKTVKNHLFDTTYLRWDSQGDVWIKYLGLTSDDYGD